jgi:aminoglycoside phosphotransferase (APT) family kinase protein
VSSDEPVTALLARGAGERRAASAGNGDAGSDVDLALGKLMADPARYFPEAAGTPRVLAVTRQGRRLSEIARVDMAFGLSRASIYVKVHRNPGAPLSRLQRKARIEFETLRHLHERFGAVPGCAVVRPIAFFPEHLAVVTEAFEGQNLHRLLKRHAAVWSGRAGQRAAAEHCRMAGVWLRHFQAITDQGRQEPLPGGQLLEWIEADVALCVKLGLSPADGAGLVDCVRARIAALRDYRFAVVGQHPDFQPDNVLVSPRGVTVLDFTSFQHGAPFSDIARFAASLEFLGKSPLYPRRRLRGLAAAFLRGYGEGATATKPAMVLYFIQHMVRAARTVGSWPRPPGLKRIVERQTMRFLAGWWRELSRAGDGYIDAIVASDRSSGGEPPARREIPT